MLTYKKIRGVGESWQGIIEYVFNLMSQPFQQKILIN